MDRLWTPWRSTYIAAKKADGCVFCNAAASDQDQDSLIVHRAKLNFILLNRYPYTNGHVMIAPYQHVSRLNELPEDATAEIMQLARAAEQVLQRVYVPDGLNLGLNLGEAAGAGIADHLHLHALPRWRGDANFMTSIGDTRVIPEMLNETYAKVRAGFAAMLTDVDV